MIFEVEGIVGLFVLGLWLYALFDVITTDDSLVRNLPKGLWIILVLFLFDVGAIAWLLLGRPHMKSWKLGETGYSSNAKRRPLGPEDRATYAPGFPAESMDTSSMNDIVREREEAARLKVWEAQLKRREDELRARESTRPVPSPKPDPSDFS